MWCDFLVDKCQSLTRGKNLAVFSEFTTRTQWSICTFLQVSWQKPVFCNYFLVLLQFSWQKKKHVLCNQIPVVSYQVLLYFLRMSSLSSILWTHGKLGSKVIGSVGYFTPRNTPFISRWNKPLILTIDPNFQRNIPWPVGPSFIGWTAAFSDGSDTWVSNDDVFGERVSVKNLPVLGGGCLEELPATLNNHF